MNRSEHLLAPAQKQILLCLLFAAGPLPVPEAVVMPRRTHRSATDLVPVSPLFRLHMSRREQDAGTGHEQSETEPSEELLHPFLHDDPPKSWFVE